MAVKRSPTTRQKEAARIRLRTLESMRNAYQRVPDLVDVGLAAIYTAMTKNHLNAESRKHVEDILLATMRKAASDATTRMATFNDEIATLHETAWPGES